MTESLTKNAAKDDWNKIQKEVKLQYKAKIKNLFACHSPTDPPET